MNLLRKLLNARAQSPDEPLRRFAVRAAIACAVLGVLGLAGVTVSASRVRADRDLATSGATAEGTVTAVSSRWNSLGSDDVGFEFSVNGRLVHATVPVEDGSRYPIGGKVQVHYDRNHPAHAVIAGMQRPVVMPLIGWFLLAGSVLVAAITAVWILVLRRVYAAGAQCAATVSTVGRTFGLARSTLMLVTLADSTYELRLLPGPARSLINERATVYGKGRAGTVAVIETANGILWPAATLKLASA